MIKYICDKCKKEFDEKSVDKPTFKVPAGVYSQETGGGITKSRVTLCYWCRIELCKRINDFLYEERVK